MASSPSESSCSEQDVSEGGGCEPLLRAGSQPRTLSARTLSVSSGRPRRTLFLPGARVLLTRSQRSLAWPSLSRRRFGLLSRLPTPSRFPRQQSCGGTPGRLRGRGRGLAWPCGEAAEPHRPGKTLLNAPLAAPHTPRDDQRPPGCERKGERRAPPRSADQQQELTARRFLPSPRGTLGTPRFS